MARAQESAPAVVDDVQSRFGITVDLTDSGPSGDGEPRVGLSLADAGTLRPAVAGARGSGHPLTVDGLERPPQAQTGLSVPQPSLPQFILGDARPASAGLGALAPLYRMFDLILAGVLLLLLTPLMIAAAVAIKLDSPGPVLYRHPRLGRNGRKLGVLKFRSMVVDADRKIEEARLAVLAQNGTTLDAPTFKSADDPRVTRVGRFLRRSGIDEIPQLFNVLSGHMSVVGPRPLVVDEVAMLSPEQAKLRHMVRPGITCLWQVFRTESTTFAERMDLDLLYVKHRSFRLYLTLVVITPLALFRGRGAC